MPQQSINALDRRSYSPQNDSVSNAVNTSTEQNISVTDIISEGPIEGLVNGGQSVFLNNDPMFAKEEAFYKNNSTGVVVEANNKTVAITLNEESLTVKKGDGSRYLHLYNIKEVTCTASNFQERDAQIAVSLGVDISALTSATLTRVSGDDWNDDWNVSSSEAVGVTPVSEGSHIINLITNSGKIWPDIKLTEAAGDQIVGMHRAGSDLKMFAASEVDGTVNHIISIDTFLEIDTIDEDANTVTLKNFPPADAVGTHKFGITSPMNHRQQGQKHPNSGVRFNVGTLNQDPLATLEGIGTSSVALTISNNALEKFNGSNYTTVTAAGAQASQIDEVKLILQYPSGLYIQTDRSGSLYTAGVGYHIELKVTNGLDQGWRTVDPPTTNSAEFDSSRTASQTHNNDNADTLVWKFTGRTKSKFSQEIRIPLEGLQPFSGFTIRISRITKHDGEDYTQENRFAKSKGGGGIDNQLRSSRGGGGEAYRSGDKAHNTGVYLATLSQALGLIKERLNFPYTAYAHTTFNSRTFQSNPTRAYECRGMKVKVPKNYITREENDGINAKYTRTGESLNIQTMLTPQLWDGTFRPALIYTDNPAWVFYDICTNDRYGLGDFLLESDIDKFSLYKVAKYCDELVPDGKGGFEPRFRSNIYLTKSTDAYKILKDFATVFRGILYWSNSQFITVIDEPKEPIFTFTRANVIDGTFEYQTTGNRTRTNQVIVNWNNPESEYKIEPLIVEDRENIIRTGKIKSEKAVAFGCTSEGQAIRYGRWKLWTAINQTSLVSFGTGVNAAFLNPGDIVNIQDESQFRVPFSGRVSSCTSSGITIDREISSHLIASGYEYTVSVVVPKRTVLLNQESATIHISATDTAIFNRGDEVTYAKVGGSVVTLLNADEEVTNKQIVSAVDSSDDWVNLQYVEETMVEERVIDHTSVTTSDGRDTLPISSAFTITPTEGDIWAVKEVTTTDDIRTQVSYKQYKVLDIAESDKTQYNITAVEHFNAKFDSVDKEFILSDPDPLYYREDTTIDVPQPRNIRVLRTPVDNELGGEELTLEWDPPLLSSISTEAQNAFAEYEHLSEYEVTHDFSALSEQSETFIADRNELSWSFTNVRNGMHTVKVVTISKGGRRSFAEPFKIDVDDIFEGSWKRKGGIIEGGYSTREVEVLNDGTPGMVKFTGPDYVVAPFPNIRSAKANTSADSDTYELDVTALSGASWPTSGSEVQGFVFLDYSEVDQAAPDADAMRLIVRKQDKSFGGNLDYWYDAKKYIADPASIWVSAGTVEVTQGSSKIIGQGFSSLDIPDTVKIGTGYGGKVAWVRSDTEIYLDRPWLDESSSSQALYRQELDLDYERDFLIAEVYYSSAEEKYYLGVGGSGTWLKIAPNLSVAARTLLAPATPSTLNYETSGTLSTTYTGITIDITAMGFQYAQTKVTGAGFSQTNQDADADFIDASDNARSITVHQGTDAIAYATGTPLNFTVDAREKLDPDNTAKQRSRVISIVKMKDGSIGVDGKTGTLNAQDYSIIYDTEAKNPSYNNTNDNITLTANTSSFTEAVFKLTQKGPGAEVDLQDWALANAVGSIAITAEGSGYTSVPTVVFTAPPSGITATGTAKVENNKVTAITITNPGLGYTSAPTISFTGGGGASAAATAALSTLTYAFGGVSNIPVTFNSADWPKVIKLEVGEKPETWSAGTAPDEIEATDSVSLIGVRAGAGGLAIVNSNHAHSYTTDNEGLIGGSHNQTITGSGTTLEVLAGGTVLDYKADSTTAYGYSTALADGEWKIAAAVCSTGAAHIQVGDPTGADTNDVVTIGDHKTGTGGSAANITDDNEVVAYSIVFKIAGEEDKTIKTTQTLSKSKGGDTGGTINIAFVRVPEGTTPVALVDTGEDLPADFTISSVTYEWKDTIADTVGTDFLWQVFGRKAAGATEYTWATPDRSDAAGALEVYIYSDVIADGGNAPDRPNLCTYNFTTGVLTIADSDNAIAQSWNLTAPSVAADGDVVYRSTALILGPKDATNWPITETASPPTKNGWYASSVNVTRVDGEAGAQIQEIDLYYPLSAPYSLPGAAPTTGTYTFSTGVVASIPTGWTQTKPIAGGVTGTAAAQSKALATEAEAGGDTSGTLTWTTPVYYAQGSPLTDFIFKYSSTAPTAAPGTDPSAGHTIWPALPSGWSTTVPASGTGKLYSSKGVAAFTLGVGFQFTWELPVLHVQVKADIGLDQVDNQSASTILNNPAITGTPTGLTQTHVGLPNTPNLSLASILGGTFTGPFGSISNADMQAWATAGGTANQSTNAYILGLNHTGTVGGVANATLLAGASAGSTANQQTTAAIRQGVITATITGGSNNHSWTNHDTGEYAPTSSTQVATIQWRDGEGTLKTTATITSTLNTTDNNIDVTRSGSGVSFTGTTANIGGAGSTTTATYNNIKVSVFHSVVDMSGWTFKGG